MPRQLLSIILVLTSVSTLYSQRDVPFSTEEYFGGGIGYTPSFLLLDMAASFPFNLLGSDETGTDLLGSSGLGFTDEDIASLGDFLIVHGAEGFGNVSGNWRVGAYVGLGSKGVARVDTTTDLRVDLKVALMTGSASVEYVIPLFSNLEIAAGSLFGISRAIIQFAKKDVEPSWEGQFTFTDIDVDNYSVALSGTFFSFQPYVAIKLQFLDRAGLRMSAGYNVGTLPENGWTLNDFGKIQAPSASSFNAPAVRVMLYLGI
ncbi:MAG: hypothetical protein JSU61_12095 [Fidelibacterota bacterium]|nr:MAG: hypothetical protein JSU61_12095 [Candidatus Neomarinimicrobiota bacterium]